MVVSGAWEQSAASTPFLSASTPSSHACIYTCMCVRVYIHACTHTHTHVHACPLHSSSSSPLLPSSPSSSPPPPSSFFAFIDALFYLSTLLSFFRSLLPSFLCTYLPIYLASFLPPSSCEHAHVCTRARVQRVHARRCARVCARVHVHTCTCV